MSTQLPATYCNSLVFVLAFFFALLVGFCSLPVEGAVPADTYLLRHATIGVTLTFRLKWFLNEGAP